MGCFALACNYADLWKKLHILIESRPRGSVTISKVKGHASHRDVKRGKVKMQDKVGNDGADALATTGAAAHALPPHVVRRTMLQFAVTEDVQRLMVDIVTARSSHARFARTTPQHKHRQTSSIQAQPGEQFVTLQPISVFSEASDFSVSWGCQGGFKRQPLQRQRSEHRNHQQRF